MEPEPFTPAPRGLGARALRRRAPRRHGVRRRRRGRALDRPGQGGRLLHGDQRRGRHRRDAPRRVPRGPRGRADRVGARSSASTPVDFLGFQDGILEYGVPLRRAIAEVVRGHRPEIVITGNFRDTWGGRNLNQADHIAVGRAVLDAVRDAGNRWIFPEQLTDGPRAVGRREGGLGRSAPPTPTHAVDTTDTFDAGVASLRGARGLHRRPRLGELRPARVPRGLRPADRPAARAWRSPRRSRCSRWAGASSQSGDARTGAAARDRRARSGSAPPVGLEPTTLRLTAECSAS